MTIVDIANKIKKSGGTLYLVGGALRDRLLGRDTNDEDYCITGITADIFIKMFPEAKIRGKWLGQKLKMELVIKNLI